MQFAQTILIIENAETTGDIRNMVKIKGFLDFYRIRIGQYRIGLKIEDDTVYFVTLEHRKVMHKAKKTSN
jgi:mRNA interferase RelE/StbE